MFSVIGKLVDRAWLVFLLSWVVLAGVLHLAAPAWSTIARDGEFSFLPDHVPSRRADELFNRAFPHDLLSSSIVVVVSRETEELQDADRQFITEVLRPRLEEIADAPGSKGAQAGISTAASKAGQSANEPPVVSRIRAFDADVVGTLLISNDGRATLVILELTTDYASRQNRPTIRAIEQTLSELRQQKLVPAGLDLHLTGSAVVGRDITLASEMSAAGTEKWTIVLVLALTLAVYRAPLLALIPLITLYFAMLVALKTLALLAGAGVVEVFTGIQAYTTVVVYASGVDYCLFLISRFQEELNRGVDRPLAMQTAIGKVGPAIAASALTEIVGIGMLGFARFGKLHQAGIAIAVSLFVMLVAVLTLTPALLRLAGRWAFWPAPQRELVARTAAEAQQAPRDDRFHRLWERISEAVLCRPALYWLASTTALLPFAVVGALWYNNLNYDLVGNLPRGAPSVAGTEVLERHFPAGAAGPVNLLIRSDHLDFRSPEGIEAVKTLTDQVREHRQELQIADLRSIATPLGAVAGERVSKGEGVTRQLLTAATVRRRAMDYFVSSDETLNNHVTRLELQLNLDPFSEAAMDFLGPLENGLKGLLPDDLQSGTELLFSGSTASLRDMKTVGVGDRNRINLLVVGSVFVLLLILLRKTALTVYLLVTVVFSYLVTLGVTFVVFYLADRRGFPGLDWTVPLFLFTVLIAIGEDYNILLVTRIHEEELLFGLERGVAVALARTGPIISSCGIIMAGTFLSLWIGGELARMTQLGFALAFGVLLDTFVVRPVLVPTFLILLDRGHLGFLGLSQPGSEAGNRSRNYPVSVSTESSATEPEPSSHRS
jgi:RND superfamily putative drug exporter